QTRLEDGADLVAALIQGLTLTGRGLGRGIRCFYSGRKLTLNRMRHLDFPATKGPQYCSLAASTIVRCHNPPVIRRWTWAKGAASHVLQVARWPLSLSPGKPSGLPTRNLPSVPVRIQWSLKSVRHIAAATIARRRHHPRSPETPAARTTDEQQFAVLVGANVAQCFAEAFHECGIRTVAGKALPFDKDRPLTDAVEIWEPNVGPLSGRSHIDQAGGLTRLALRPRILHRHAIDVDVVHAVTLNAA